MTRFVAGLNGKFELQYQFINKFTDSFKSIRVKKLFLKTFGRIILCKIDMYNFNKKLLKIGKVLWIKVWIKYSSPTQNSTCYSDENLDT